MQKMNQDWKHGELGTNYSYTDKGILGKASLEHNLANVCVPLENGLEMCMNSNRTYHTAQCKHLDDNALQHCFP